VPEQGRTEPRIYPQRSLRAPRVVWGIGVKASYRDSEIGPGYSSSISFWPITENPDPVRMIARGTRCERRGERIVDRRLSLLLIELQTPAPVVDLKLTSDWLHTPVCALPGPELRGIENTQTQGGAFPTLRPFVQLIFSVAPGARVFTTTNPMPRAFLLRRT
jgi:hypothetical protein